MKTTRNPMVLFVILGLLTTACGNRVLDDSVAAQAVTEQSQTTSGALDSPVSQTPAVTGQSTSTAPQVGSAGSSTSGTTSGNAQSSSATSGTTSPSTTQVPDTGPAPDQPTSEPTENATSPGTAPTESSNVGAGQTLIIATVDHQTAPVGICRGAYEGVASFFADLNERGGVNGYKFELRAYDDGMDPNRNQQLVQQAIQQDGAVALVGFCSELASTGSGPITEEAGIPVIGGAGTASVWYQTSNWFANSGSQQELYPKFFMQYGSQTGCTKVGNLYINVPQGHGGASFARQYAPQFGMEIVFDSAFSLTEPDFTSFVVKMQQAGVECIHFPGVNDHIIRLLKAMEQQGMDDARLIAPLPGYDPTIGPAVGNFVDDHFIAIINHRPLQTADGGTVQRYQQALATYFPNFTGNTWSIDGWSSGEMFAEAVRRIGDEPVTRESVMAAMRTFNGWEGTFTPPLTFAASGPSAFPAGCNYVVNGLADGTYVPESDGWVCTDSY